MEDKEEVEKLNFTIKRKPVMALILSSIITLIIILCQVHTISLYCREIDLKLKAIIETFHF